MSSVIRIPEFEPVIKTKYRSIVTDISVSESLWVFEKLSKYEARAMHGQLPVVWDHALDFSVYDKYGNRWIDFTSGIFVANTGHSNPHIIKALRDQISRGLLYSYTFATEARARFLEKLIRITPPQFEKAFLMSSGTEATECAIKLARMRGMKINPDKNVIISFQGAMHGRTMGAEMLKGDPEGSKWIGYKDPNMYHLRIPYPWEEDQRHILFEKDLTNLESRLAAVIIESYTGWCAYFYPVEYIQKLCQYAKEDDALIIFDEIQSGFGRTGKLFAYEHYGVEPDMLCLGKGLSGSLPLSAVIGSKEVMDIPNTGSMSSTFSANPMSCVAGLANLEYLEKFNLVQESSRKGRMLSVRLNEMQIRFPDKIEYVFGIGLVAGIVFNNVEVADLVCNSAMKQGLLLVHTGRESVKIGPPLTIVDEALLEGLDVLEEVIGEL